MFRLEKGFDYFLFRDAMVIVAGHVLVLFRQLLEGGRRPIFFLEKRQWTFYADISTLKRGLKVFAFILDVWYLCKREFISIPNGYVQSDWQLMLFTI